MFHGSAHGFSRRSTWLFPSGKVNPSTTTAAGRTHVIQCFCLNFVEKQYQAFVHDVNWDVHRIYMYVPGFRDYIGKLGFCQDIFIFLNSILQNCTTCIITKGWHYEGDSCTSIKNFVFIWFLSNKFHRVSTINNIFLEWKKYVILFLLLVLLHIWKVLFIWNLYIHYI